MLGQEPIPKTLKTLKILLDFKMAAEASDRWAAAHAEHRGLQKVLFVERLVIFILEKE